MAEKCKVVDPFEAPYPCGKDLVDGECPDHPSETKPVDAQKCEPLTDEEVPLIYRSEAEMNTPLSEDELSLLKKIALRRQHKRWDLAAIAVDELRASRSRITELEAQIAALREVIFDHERCVSRVYVKPRFAQCVLPKAHGGKCQPDLTHTPFQKSAQKGGNE